MVNNAIPVLPVIGHCVNIFHEEVQYYVSSIWGFTTNIDDFVKVNKVTTLILFKQLYFTINFRLLHRIQDFGNLNSSRLLFPHLLSEHATPSISPDFHILF